ncbi:MAG: ferrous iron transport protein B [Erysipelotrichaceae bacterium]|jgi:ferrous iron transport protein B|nr:ferrous iron transport protein B [Erysipelotrichaceae bacterium]
MKTIAFIGNPNSGKTTLFNAYTGAHLKVANWPGVTVEKKEGAMKYHNESYKLVDLPGTYSLTCYTMEELVARDFIVSDEVDLLIDVVDASSLERNLYLTLQLIEMDKPVVMALNMMDIVTKRGMEIDLHRLPEMLGIPVIAVSARNRKGLDVLIHAAAHHLDEKEGNAFILHYSEEIEGLLGNIELALKNSYPELKNPRWVAIKHLEMDEQIQKLYPLKQGIVPKGYGSKITDRKYRYIEEVMEEVLVNQEKIQVRTDKLDAIMTHKIWGLPIFLCIMGLIFFLTFTLGDWLKGYFELGLDAITQLTGGILEGLHVHPILSSLILDGILAGVGGMLSFLPNIFILFLALAFLEDTGYMARVAYVMDGVMGKLGVSGKAFIPMLLGFGCSVPAVMATRSLEDPKDRWRMTLIIPFMSCSAKIPIYVLFAGMFFPKQAILVSYSLYILGVLVAIICALLMHFLDKEKDNQRLLLELPEYKIPSLQTVLIFVWEKVKDYLTRAGTIILLASIFMWLLLNLGPNGFTTDITQSFGSILGKYLVFLLAPLGLGYWQISVALLGGLSAKEVVVSSFAVLFGIANLASPQGANELVPLLGNIGFGPLNAYCLMVFALLYPPCFAAMATIKRETGSWKKLGIAALFQLGTAWLVTFFIYQIASRF